MAAVRRGGGGRGPRGSRKNRLARVRSQLLGVLRACAPATPVPLAPRSPPSPGGWAAWWPKERAACLLAPVVSFSRLLSVSAPFPGPFRAPRPPHGDALGLPGVFLDPAVLLDTPRGGFGGPGTACLHGFACLCRSFAGSRGWIGVVLYFYALYWFFIEH
jgi:hypothetical protein